MSERRSERPTFPGGTQRPETVLAHGAGYQLVETLYAPRARLAPHQHTFSNLSLVLTGSLVEESESGTISAGPGCAVFKPAGAEHADRIGADGARVFALRIDPGWSIASTAIFDYAWRSQDGIARIMLLLYATARAVDEPSLTPWLAALGESTSSASMSSSPAWLASVQDRLHRGAEAPSDIRALAQERDTHPVYLARAFRKCFGSSPTGYSRRARMTQAARELVVSETPAAVIAARFGFADHAHFCRCFRAQVGVTPGAYRRAARAL